MDEIKPNVVILVSEAFNIEFSIVRNVWEFYVEKTPGTYGTGNF